MDTTGTTKRKTVPRPLRIAGWVIGGIAIAVVFAFIFGYFVMLLWNWIMPAIFGLPEIDYWLAFGIIILARLIFGGFGHGNHKCDGSNHHERFYESKYRRKFDRKFDKLSKWSLYEDYWSDEGKEAFERYVERKRGGDDPGKEAGDRE